MPVGSCTLVAGGDQVAGHLGKGPRYALMLASGPTGQSLQLLLARHALQEIHLHSAAR